MTVRVEQMTSEVAATAGAAAGAAADLPLTEAQIEKLLQIVMRRMAERERDDRYGRESNALRRRVAPGAPIER